MRARIVGLVLSATVLAVLAWDVGSQPLPAQEVRGGKGKSNHQVVGAGLMTAVLFDPDTGKTWALTPGDIWRGPGSFGGPNQEFAWAPVAKFDDVESYKRWVKEQQERQRKMREEMYGKKDKDKGFDRKDRDFDKKDKEIDKKDAVKDKRKD
jgi:hypothetical protein